MSASPLDDKPNLLRRTLPEILGVLIFVLAGYWLRHGTLLNPDSSWYLISTAWWLDGARIGEDIIEINPPLAFYLNAPPVSLARLMNWDSTQAMTAYVFTIWFVSVTWLCVIGARCYGVSPTRRRALVAVTCLALILVAIKDFAQRDFLMILFTLPYLALVAFRPNKLEMTTAERILIGLYATLGLALKPHFLVLPAAMTLLEVVRRRSLAPVLEPQNLAIAFGCLAYLSAAYLVHPAYFNNVVPLALLTYTAYGHSPYSIVLSTLPIYTACILAFFGLLKLEGQTFDIGLRFLVAALAGVVFFLLQFKGWTYHLLPATVMTFLTCFWVVMGLFKNRRHVIRGGSIALVSSAFLVGPLLWRGAHDNVYAKALAPFFQNEPGERTFLTMAPHLFISFPLANMASAEPVSRFPALWIIPGAITRLELEPDLTATQNAQLDEALAYARQATVEDFLRGEPELVVVDVRDDKTYFKGVTFDYLAFFGTDPQFEELWQRYRRVGNVLGFDVYRRDE